MRALRDLPRLGLAAEHRSALSVVAFIGPIPIGALARSERVTAPAMTKTVGILEAAGLVRRQTDPQDGRRVCVSATPAGVEMVRKGRDERVAKIRQGMKRLTAEQAGRLAAGVASLERVVADLEPVRRSSRSPRAAGAGRTANRGR